MILCDYVPVKNSMLALNLRSFFILVPDFQFMLFDPQLTIKLSIVFNWTPDFVQLVWKNSIQFFENPKLLNWTRIKLPNLIFHLLSPKQNNLTNLKYN